MKFIFFALIISFSLLACSSEPKKLEPVYIPVSVPKEKPPLAKGYYCPMKCEGEKVYPSDRNHCPVCDMKLIPTPATQK